MRTLSILLLYFLLSATVVRSNDLYNLRQLYYEATGKKDSAKKFLRIMEKLDVTKDAVLLCYKGMANLIQANHSYNPYIKLASFTKGKSMLETAVSADPKNIEIRFMRFCVQTNAPFFLGYSNNISVDKKAIINGWISLTDEDLKEKIRKYMLDSNSLITSEKLIFKA